MKSDISGRQKVEPIFNIFLLFIFFRILHTHAIPAMLATASNFLLHLHGRKRFESKYVFINEMFACHVSVAFCPHIYTCTLLSKMCLHLDWLAVRNAISIDVAVDQINPWKHLYLIILHKTGTFLMLDFFWNQLYTAQVFLMLGWRIEFPLKAYNA